MSNNSERPDHYLEDTGEVDENGNRIYIEKKIDPIDRSGAYGIGYSLGQKAKEHPVAAVIIAIIIGIVILIIKNS